MLSIHINPGDTASLSQLVGQPVILFSSHDLSVDYVQSILQSAG